MASGAFLRSLSEEMKADALLLFQCCSYQASAGNEIDNATTRFVRVSIFVCDRTTSPVPPGFVAIHLKPTLCCSISFIFVAKSIKDGKIIIFLCIANANLVWSDEKVCRNFLCGTCPRHALFTNTTFVELLVCLNVHVQHIQSPILNTSKPSILQPRTPAQMTQFSTGFRWKGSTSSTGENAKRECKDDKLSMYACHVFQSY